MAEKLTKQQIKEITKNLKDVEVQKEERPQCFHLHLRKLKDDDMFYQCEECKTIFFIFGCTAYNKEGLEIVLKDVLEKAE